MTREELMLAVVEAARKAIADWDRELAMQVSPMRDALSALDAHRPEPEGEMVEVRADVFRFRDGKYEVREHGYMTLPHHLHIATITARVPLPTIPTVAARVET